MVPSYRVARGYQRGAHATGPSLAAVCLYLKVHTRGISIESKGPGQELIHEAIGVVEGDAGHVGFNVSSYGMQR